MFLDLSEEATHEQFVAGDKLRRGFIEQIDLFVVDGALLGYAARINGGALIDTSVVLFAEVANVIELYIVCSAMPIMESDYVNSVGNCSRMFGTANNCFDNS